MCSEYNRTNMNQRCKYLAVALPIVTAPKVRTTGAAAVSSSMSRERTTYQFDLRQSFSMAVVFVAGSRFTASTLKKRQ